MTTQKNRNRQTSAKNKSVFVLPSQIDISSVNQLCEEVKSSCATDNIEFDASAVDRITTPGVQVLIAAYVSAQTKGNKITVLSPSESFQNTLSNLGLSRQLNEWVGSNV